MKTNRNIVIICMLCSLLFVSCESTLEKYPLDYPSTETFLRNEAELEMAIVGAHSPIASYLMGGLPFFLYLDNGSDIASDRDHKPEAKFHSATGADIVALWENIYKCISRCNFILDNIDRATGNVSAERLEEYKAKAKVLRAYCYLTLTSMYGDVPLIDRTLSLEEAYVSRQSVEEVTDFILKECGEASQYLQQTNEPNTMAITKGFAWAIQARAALYNERWQDAINACEKIMALEGSEYILEPNFGDITMLKGKTSKEVIWAIQFNQDNISHSMPRGFKSRLAGGFCNRLPVQALVDSYECIDGLSIDKSPLYDPQNPWENRDPRLHETVALPGTIYYGYQFETNIDSTMCWNYNQSPAVRISNADATHTYASFSGYCWRKYCDPLEHRADGASSINGIAFRYADILLMYAEAKIELNQLDASVYESINKVRRRAKMPIIASGKSQQELRAAVRKERKYELAGEGLRMFDIRRWRIADKLMNGICYGRVPNGYPSAPPPIDEYGNPDYSDGYAERERLGIKLGLRYFNPERDYVSPIPWSDIQTNPNLEQNPGY